MPDTPTNTARVGAWFGVQDAPSLGFPLLGSEDFVVSHIKRPVIAVGGDHIALPAADAYLVTLYLRDTHHNDVLADGSETPIRLYREGSVCLVDLKQGAAIRLHRRLDCLVFHLPRQLFGQIAKLPQAPKDAMLRCRRGEDDDTIRHLGTAARALVDMPSQVVTEPMRHIGIALGVHLLHHYAEPSEGDALSIWAETDAKAFMIAHHARPIRMADVAASAGLAERPFAKGFQRAAGVSPTRWLARYRVARAKEFLTEDDLPIAEIATICGFRSEGQMASSFRRETGLSPANWLNRTGS